MSDDERYRTLFPITRTYAFLDHAAVAPLGRHVTLAVDAHLERVQQVPFHLLRPGLEQTAQEFRQRAARLINAAQADEIALIVNAATALAAVAARLPLQSGDNVLVLEGDDPTTVLPWLNLAYRGVLVRRLPQRGGGLDAATIEGWIDKRTRAILVSSVVGSTGVRNDLAAVGAVCRKRGILFVVDASNSLGVLPIDVEASQIDMLVASGERWLLAGLGSGVLYCRRDIMGDLEPNGYSNDNSDEAHDGFVLHSELLPTTTTSYESLVALHASLGLLLEIGINTISERVLDLAALLINSLREHGYSVRASRDYKRHSGIVVVDLPDALAAQRRLAAATIIVSALGDGLRISPHFYNTEAEVLRVSEVLGKAR